MRQAIIDFQLPAVKQKFAMYLVRFSEYLQQV
jgi:hypothetical protein